MTIGIFDSGLGGLTVFRAVRALMPCESLLYLGDNARVPYGNKSAETVTRYSIENADFLVERGVKALVVGCNTSTAFALPTLVARYNMPVLGVIAPGAARAAAVSTCRRIGVIGTAGTIASRAYAHAITALAPDAKIFERACPLFVPLVEEGWIDSPITQEIIAHYIEPLCREQIDTLILGCTHYPLLALGIRAVVGEKIHLVDSGAATAVSLQATLREKNMCASADATPTHQLFMTDATPNIDRFVANVLGDMNRGTTVHFVRWDDRSLWSLGRGTKKPSL